MSREDGRGRKEVQIVLYPMTHTSLVGGAAALTTCSNLHNELILFQEGAMFHTLEELKRPYENDIFDLTFSNV